MINVLSAKRVTLVSTIELQAQVERLRSQIPELRGLRAAMSPQDPRREVVDLSLDSAQKAIRFLEDSNV